MTQPAGLLGHLLLELRRRAGTLLPLLGRKHIGFGHREPALRSQFDQRFQVEGARHAFSELGILLPQRQQLIKIGQRHR